MATKIRILIAISILTTFSVLSQSSISIEKLNENINKSELIDNESYMNILNFFKVEEKSDFISNGRIEYLYKIINSIKSKAEKDESYVSVLLRISLILNKNVELSEYLSECVSDVACDYSENFVKAYYKLYVDDKELIKDDLFWLIEKEQYESFKKKINSFKFCEKYIATIDELSILNE